jgi:DNA-directed RNA polymerase specialized sigma24 family protein
MQRTVVYLVEGCGWGLTDTGRLLDISISTVRNHLARGMTKLRAALEVQADAR